METIRVQLQNPAGIITIESRQFKTTYSLHDERHLSIGSLVDTIKRIDQYQEESDMLALELNLLKLERQYLKMSLHAATKPRTIDDMFVELSDRGVETTRLQIPCIGENCKEVCVEEMDAPMRLDEIAVLASHAGEFTDGRCPSCSRQEQQENAEEDKARDQHEAREEMCNE